MRLPQRYFHGRFFVLAIGGTGFLAVLTVALPVWGVRTIIEATTVTEQRSETCDQLFAESPWLGWVRIADAVVDFHDAVTTQYRRNNSNRYGPDIYVPVCRADAAHGGMPRILVRISDSRLAERLLVGDPGAIATRPIEGTISISSPSSEIQGELGRRFGVRNPNRMTVIDEGARPGTVSQGVGETLGGLLCGALFLLAVRAWIARARGAPKTA